MDLLDFGAYVIIFMTIAFVFFEIGQKIVDKIKALKKK